MSTPRKRTPATPSHIQNGTSTGSFLFRALNFTANPLCLLAIVSLCFAGCADLKVKKPASDSTPPALVWNVYNHDTRAKADHPGSPTLNAKRGEHYRIILKANDSGGVKSIQINPAIGSGEMSWTCKAPPGGENVAQSKTATLKGLKQNLAPDSNGDVLTSIFLIFELDFSMDCQAGWNFSAGHAQLTGRASNYFGGTTNEVIKFNITP
jgi:hypothetical protein